MTVHAHSDSLSLTGRSQSAQSFASALDTAGPDGRDDDRGVIRSIHSHPNPNAQTAQIRAVTKSETHSATVITAPLYLLYRTENTASCVLGL